jgi:hypothetical protein
MSEVRDAIDEAARDLLASVHRDCCWTTFTARTEERAIALHVEYHNSAVRRQMRPTTATFIDADEQPLQRDPDVVRALVAALQDAKVDAREFPATYDWRAAARHLARMAERAHYSTQSDALLAAHDVDEFRTVCAEAALALFHATAPV